MTYDYPYPYQLNFGTPCPSCGHCPHCGRGGYPYSLRPVWVVQPYGTPGTPVWQVDPNTAGPPSVHATWTTCTS